MRRAQRLHRAQRLDRQRRDRREDDLARRGLGHPPRDREVEAVGSAHRDRQVRVARGAHQFEFCTGERMERVMDANLQRLGIVECCS